MRTFVAAGAACAFLAVALGAFGAHSLRSALSAERMAVYQTGVQYHMAHALGLLLVALLSERLTEQKPMRAAGWLLLAGILLFSGSLYLLALSGIGMFGAITPLGGVCFLSAWALVAVAALKERR